jgi:C-terminus of AA_permease
VAIEHSGNGLRIAESTYCSDARNLVPAPGFIDIYNHSDGDTNGYAGPPGFFDKHNYSLGGLSLDPLAGIASCLALMTSLPCDIWIRLVVWLALGFLVYGTYGPRHSQLRRSGRQRAPERHPRY